RGEAGAAWGGAPEPPRVPRSLDCVSVTSSGQLPSVYGNMPVRTRPGERTRGAPEGVARLYHATDSSVANSTSSTLSTAHAAGFFRLVEPDDRFREGVVVRIAGAADRGLDAGLSDPLGVPNRQTLYPAITVMAERLGTSARAIVERLLQGHRGPDRSQRALFGHARASHHCEAT